MLVEFFKKFLIFSLEYINRLRIQQEFVKLVSMPIIKSAKKKLKQDKHRTAINKSIRTRAKKAIISFRKNPNPDRLKLVYRLIDRAAKKQVFKKNKAARIKSRLAKFLQKNKPKQENSSKRQRGKKTKKL